MVKSAIRYRPPKIEPSRAVDWLFARAFGPGHRNWEGRKPIDLAALDSFIGAFEILPRIWSRTDRDLLEEELEPADFHSIEQDSQTAVAIEIRDHEACTTLAAVARQLDAPMLFLKGMALRLGGHVETGTRMAADIDVLVSEGRARRFHQKLLEQGSVAKDLPASDQHLPVVEHSSGALVEVHHRLRGVVLGSVRDSRLNHPFTQGLCRELAGDLSGTYVPRKEVLVAHLLVHALGQHTFWPAAYPQIQLIADLQDLGIGDEISSTFLDEILQWTESGVAKREVPAVFQLVERLSRGDRLSEIVEGEDEMAGMARHIVAGASDSGYRQALKAEGSLRVVAGQSPSHSALVTLKKAIFLTRGQIDIIYGPPKTSLGYLGRRLWRPLDLLGRTWRSAMTWLQVRQR